MIMPLPSRQDIQFSPSRLRREDGIAMLTVLMLTIILTVIGIAAITTTTMDMWMAGGERNRETSVNVAEACLSSGVQIIQQTLQAAAIPANLVGAGLNPQILPADAATLQAEILGQNNQSIDSADVTSANFAPNAKVTMPGGYIVYMDIDRLYAQYMVGSAIAFAAGYEGVGAGAASGGVQVLYRIDCYASGGTGRSTVNTHISAVYACVVSGESCQRKIG